MKRAKTYQKFIAGAAAFSVVLLWLCAASPMVDPRSFSYAGVVGLAFPFFLAGVLLMLCLCLLLAARYTWIPLLGLLCAYQPVFTYFPVHPFSSAPPDGALKVMTFNVRLWGTWTDGYDEGHKHNLIAQYVAASGSDIVCLQEAYTTDKTFAKYIDPVMQVYAHRDTVRFDYSALALYTRFPILKKQELCRDMTNGAVAYWLLTAPKDTLIVVNCHLKSMGMTQADREEFSDMVKHGGGAEQQHTEQTSRMVISKVAAASGVRAAMADSVAQFVRAHQRKKLMVCGDFNDTPISYTFRTIKEAGLTDAFSTTATGLGRSFNRDAIIVRIDNILCSPALRPYRCRIDRSIATSDHYPMTAYIAPAKE